MQSASAGDPQIQITLQYGNNREMVVLSRSDQPEVFESLRSRARELVSRFSGQANVPQLELNLFRHNYNIPTMLQHIGSISQLDNGCVVEVIVFDRTETPARPHVTESNTYLTPTFCDFCGEMLAGVIKQGVKCLHCKLNFHKRCYNAPRNSCVVSAGGLPTMAPAPMLPGGISIGIPQPTIITQVFIPLLHKTSNGTDKYSFANTNPASSMYGLPHSLAEHNYKNFTLCKICNNLLVGIVKQGLKCRDCGVNVHKRCAKDLPSNCTLAENAISRMSVSDGPGTPTGSLINTSTSDSSSMDTSYSNENIPLFRLPGMASKRATSQPKVDGWMIHFLRTDPERRLKHYWVLANNSINMYNEYNEVVGVNPHRCYAIVPLHEIVAITQHNGPPVISKFPPHCFEIRTIKNTVYCVGENYQAYSGGPPKKIPRNLSIRPPSNTQLWYQALREALQPPQSHTDQAPALEFSEMYQIDRERLLGSGQFGQVFTAVERHTGKEVAVKVISKERFQRKGSAAESMKTEVAMLQRTNHLGIVGLRCMCDTTDQIFVVMEKMNGDMLEMILSQATGRLSERVTKFLIVQILSALKYLHDLGIAHCDLKPENVLLSEMSSNWPQTKICDFGYARFIPEAQFRKTIVGTPAYLPPEVLSRRGYNKSLDMWSVGVIIYVTLSGTFPFNENDEVADQIQNAAFMFPNEPWNDISPMAVDLIQRLLKVELDDRLTIEQCMAHQWLKGEQLYADLRSLEVKLSLKDNERYLTNPGDDAKYAEYLARQAAAGTPVAQ